MPADFDLKDTVKRTEFLAKHEALFRDCRRLNGVFFPGGDPGNNPPELVIPYLEDLSRLLIQYHPRAKIWLSMQGFRQALVAGPSSPPIPETRARLPRQYGFRDYPDITHTVRCQYPTIWWDPSFALTLGRESVNPRAVFYKLVQNYFGPSTSGFISYSDGVQDDVNKTVWSRLGWQPGAEPQHFQQRQRRVQVHLHSKIEIPFGRTPRDAGKVEHTVHAAFNAVLECGLIADVGLDIAHARIIEARGQALIEHCNSGNGPASDGRAATQPRHQCLADETLAATTR